MSLYNTLALLQQQGAMGALTFRGLNSQAGLGGFLDPGLCEGRLSLATGDSAYAPDRSLVPSATSTVNDTVDFATLHGWATGTMARMTAASGGGGLTQHTTYWIRVVDADTISFHTTLAGAEGDTGKVDLTASVTARIEAFGMQKKTLYLGPYGGDRICLYDGTRWKEYNFSERSLAITATNATNYDVFLFDNAGTLTLETTAWTSSTARATALVAQDGVLVKSGAPTRRYLGTFRAAATDTLEDSQINRFLFNYYNRLARAVVVYETSDNWTAAVASTWRPFQNDSTNKVSVVNGVVEQEISLLCTLGGYSSPGAAYMTAGIGSNSTTANSAQLGANVGGIADIINVMACALNESPNLGLHEYTALENGIGYAGVTFQSHYDDAAVSGQLLRRSGITGVWHC